MSQKTAGLTPLHDRKQRQRKQLDGCATSRMRALSGAQNPRVRISLLSKMMEQYSPASHQHAQLLQVLPQLKQLSHLALQPDLLANLQSLHWVLGRRRQCTYPALQPNLLAKLQPPHRSILPKTRQLASRKQLSRRALQELRTPKQTPLLEHLPAAQRQPT